MRGFRLSPSARTFLAKAGCDSLSLFGLKVGAVKVKKQQPFELGRASTGMLLRYGGFSKRLSCRVHRTSHLQAILSGPFH
jgi:hypothetical protein